MNLADFRQLAMVHALGGLMAHREFDEVTAKQLAIAATKAADALVGVNTIDESIIVIWRWQDAPEELKALSTNDGNEDWVALLPAHLKVADIPWMDRHGPGGFGVSAIDEYEFDGRVVVIGSHA